MLIEQLSGSLVAMSCRDSCAWNHRKLTNLLALSESEHFSSTRTACRRVCGETPQPTEPSKHLGPFEPPNAQLDRSGLCGCDVLPNVHYPIDCQYPKLKLERSDLSH